MPNVIVSAAGMRKINSISMKLLKGVGFSKGCPLLALKKPPPLVPNSLITSWEATGPCAMTWGVCPCCQVFTLV